MRWVGNVTRIGDRRGTYRVLVGKTDGKRPRGRARRRREDNIKLDIQEVGSGTWTGLLWLRTGTDSGRL